jgi:hypothetical protein
MNGIQNRVHDIHQSFQFGTQLLPIVGASKYFNSFDWGEVEIGFFCFSDGLSYSRIFFHDKINGDINFLRRRRSIKVNFFLKF